MERTYVKDLKHGKNALLKGWVHEIRDLQKVKFLLLRDFSGIVQCVIKNPKISISNLTLETVVEIEGKTVKADVKAELARKDIEVDISSLKILSKAEKLPMQVNEKAVTEELPKRLDYRSLDIRKPRVSAIFKIQSTIANAFREFFYGKGFTEIQPPEIIATSTEGGTDVFEVNYFDRKAYLAQSPQLYKQLAAISLEKVFLVCPVWRAEKHDTSKHINEIRQMDIEVAFADDMKIMKYLEECVQFIVKKVISGCKSELEILDIKLKVPAVKYLTYSEAIALF